MKPTTYKVEYLENGRWITVIFTDPKKVRQFIKSLKAKNQQVRNSKPVKKAESKKRNQHHRKNSANSLDKKGIRYYIKAGVKEIKRLLGNLALKIRTATTSGYVEVIHSDNRGKIYRKLLDNNYDVKFGK